MAYGVLPVPVGTTHLVGLSLGFECGLSSPDTPVVEPWRVPPLPVTAPLLVHWCSWCRTGRSDTIPWGKGRCFP